MIAVQFGQVDVVKVLISDFRVTVSFYLIVITKRFKIARQLFSRRFLTTRSIHQRVNGDVL